MDDQKLTFRYRDLDLGDDPRKYESGVHSSFDE